MEHKISSPSKFDLSIFDAFFSRPLLDGQRLDLALACPHPDQSIEIAAMKAANHADIRGFFVKDGRSYFCEKVSVSSDVLTMTFLEEPDLTWP